MNLVARPESGAPPATYGFQLLSFAEPGVLCPNCLKAVAQGEASLLESDTLQFDPNIESQLGTMHLEPETDSQLRTMQLEAGGDDDLETMRLQQTVSKDADLLIDKVLDKKYRVEGRLGAGGAEPGDRV